MKLASVLLLVLALIAGMVGCPADPEPTPPNEYTLSISSTAGGQVTTPGEGTFTYDEGATANLVASPASGYSFAGWTGDVGSIANTRATSTTITINGDYSITASFQVIPAARYSLTVSSTEGGSVPAPGEGIFTYDAGTVVELVAEPDDGYGFTEWTGSVGAITDVRAASTTITMNAYCTITANFVREIRTWHELDAIRDNLGGSYVLVNDLDSTTAGYEELAGPTANDGRGWQPIGSVSTDPYIRYIVGPAEPFTGSLAGQGYEVRDLFIDRPDDHGVGLFGVVGEGGLIEDVRVMNVEVIGHVHVGSLVGLNRGTVSDCFCSADVTGGENVGGLVGLNYGAVSKSGSSGSVTGEGAVGGLAGWNSDRPISNSYSTGSVTGYWHVGGLVGHNDGPVHNSFSCSSVTGHWRVGGLVGFNNWGTVANSYYDYDEVLINGANIITIGALFGEDFQQWLANGKFLDVDERLSQENGYYMIDNVSGFQELLAFGQDDSLRFRLTNDLDLGDHPNFYVPYLAGEFDGNGHEVANLSFKSDFVSNVGLFGVLASHGKVEQVRVRNADIKAVGAVGGLVGANFGTVSTSSSVGSVTGFHYAGALVGTLHRGTVSDCHSGGSVTGYSVGGLVGWNYLGTVTNSYYRYDEVLINGANIITIGALFGEDFQQWLANDRFLDVNERLSQEDGYYVINSVSDFKQLLAFGQDDSLRFRLTNDLDLGDHPNFYVPYLAGEFDGNGYGVANLRFNYGFVPQVGLFGYVASGGKVTQVCVENANIAGAGGVGSLVGYIWQGTIDNSRATGSVAGGWQVGGLAGVNNRGTISNSYFTGSVSAHGRIGGLVGDNHFGHVRNSYAIGTVSGAYWGVGGLVGSNDRGTVRNSYSSNSVTGGEGVGGLVGHSSQGTVHHSFWDVETSRLDESEGGTGKTTAEMKDIATYRTAGWSILAVPLGQTDTNRTWNIVDGQTYPFLSWQQVS